MFLIIDYFSWWYGQGLKLFFDWWHDLIGFVNYYFSIKDLILTLFQPWKRDVVYYGDSLEGKWHALLDNLISRFIGGLLRLVVICIAIILILFLVLVGILGLLIWLAVIPLGIYLMIKAFL